MKPWKTAAFLILAGIICGLILCEAGLRFLGIEYPDFYDYDPQFGGKLRAGMEGYWLKEGGGYVRINREGLRDREHAISHPPNTLRIAVLGDSFAEAMQVNREEAFWAVMAGELQGCRNLRGRQVEVINFGQAGFGTTQELLAFRHRAQKYSPDVVLLAFYTGNDVADNSKALKQQDYHPYHVYQDNELILDDQATREKWLEEQRKKSWLGYFYRWRLDTFRIEQLLHHGQKAAWTWWSGREPRDNANASSKGSKVGNEKAIYLEPTEAVWNEAWRVTEGVLLLLRDEIGRTGAKFFLVVLTNDIQVHPVPSVRDEFARQLGVQDLFYPDRRLENLCRNAGIPVLLLGPHFQEYATGHQIFFHGFKNSLGSGHWNQNGHRLAGQILAQWLCGQIN